MRTAAAWCLSPASHKARNPAASMKMSRPGINDLIEVLVPRLPLRAGFGALCNAEKRIASSGNWCGLVHRFQTGGWLSAVREHEALTLRDPTQHTLGAFAK